MLRDHTATIDWDTDSRHQLLDQSPVEQALTLPRRVIDRRVDNFSVRLSQELGHTIWTSCRTQPTADALLRLDSSHAVFLRDRMHLASLYACPAAQTFVRVDDSVVVGVSYRVLDAPVSDSPEYATAATATVADVTESLHHIAYCMNQPDFLGSIEDGQCLVLGNVIWAG